MADDNQLRLGTHQNKPCANINEEIAETEQSQSVSGDMGKQTTEFRSPYCGKHPSENGRKQTANEYAQAVQLWLWQYQWWNQMNWFNLTFPFYAGNYMAMQTIPDCAVGQGRPAGMFPMAMQPGIFQQYSQQSQVQQRINVIENNAAGQRPVLPQQNQFPQVQPQRIFLAGNNVRRIGTDYRIPSLWKRVLAEFIDFFLLFMVKLGLTIVFVEYAGLVDLQKYDIDFLMSQNMDYNTAFAMTSELIAMEVINRIFICFFETLCLHRGIAGPVGGTTPGKRIMGLRVVSCDQIIELPRNRVRIIPALNIGVWNAFVRSIIKNFSLAFFFPVCFTVLFFQHNRAAYDVISSCIVVESPGLDPY